MTTISKSEIISLGVMTLEVPGLIGPDPALNVGV